MIDLSRVMECYKLKNLTRYNNRVRVKDESVAEHSYFVVLFTMMICDELEVSDEIRLDAIRYAIIHDMPEIYMSDIPHDVKEISADFRGKIKELEDMIMKEKFPRYYHVFTNSEHVKPIIHLADILSVIQYIELESHLGNATMFSIDDVIPRLERVCAEIEEKFGKKLEINLKGRVEYHA